MNSNEIDDALEALRRLEKEALAHNMQPGVAAGAARGGLKADADEVRRAIEALRARGEGS